MANDVLTGVTVKVQPRSGFDKSRKNIFTTKVGTLTPMLTDLIIPNSDVNVKMAISAALPPLASETFMRASFKVEAFFVPLRLLYGGFESWLTGSELYNNNLPFRAELPRLKVTSSHSLYFGPGSLLDYLGAQIGSTSFSTNQTTIYLNVFPLVAYARIYDDWYRNTKVQKPLFVQPGTMAVQNNIAAGVKLRSLPFCGYDQIYDLEPNSTFNDGSFLGQLRQRNYGVDYFTCATPQAQFGSPMTFTPDALGNISISAVRNANSMQIFEERQGLSGQRIQDYCKANYGARLSSGVAQRAIYLGSADYPVYSKGVYANQGVTATNNPFTSVGARYGSAYASGTDFVVKAHFDEPGVFMILGSLVPEANYDRRISKHMSLFTQLGSLTDLPNPILQNVGNDTIEAFEVNADVDMTAVISPFGFVPRYTWAKTSINEVHGLLLSGQSLDSFVAKRLIGGSNPTIGNLFLKVNTTDLDNVTAVTAQLSSYGVWVDSYIQYYCSMPLARYSMPSLQDPAYEHGNSVHIPNNGSKL